MSAENPQQDFEAPEAPDIPAFEKIQWRHHLLIYKFPDVQISIDTSGQNYKDLPELSFGTYDTSSGRWSISQPKSGRVDMAYIKKCVAEMAKDSHVHKFWFYPHGGDDETREDKRSQARLRLFKRFFQIEPAPTGSGYILEIPPVIPPLEHGSGKLQDSA